jgi:hypothetical protein
MTTIPPPTTEPVAVRQPREPLPVNRIIAFLGPYIAVFAGAVADWLFVHVHFLANFHNHSAVAGWVSQVTVWALTSLLVWLGQAKWLDGWQRWESAARTRVDL